MPASVALRVIMLIAVIGSALAESQRAEAQDEIRIQVQPGDIPPPLMADRNREEPDRFEYFVPVLPPPPPLPNREPIPPERLERLIVKLKSDDYHDRMEATRELKDGGEETVQALRAAALEGSPEVYRRAIAVLTSIFLCPDDDAARAAEDTLEELRDHGAISLAVHIEQVFETNDFVRTERALEAIEALGGKIEYSPYMADTDAITGRQRRSISLIRLPQTWKGGDRGLRYVARIPTLPQLMVIRKKGGPATISDNALTDLQAKLPNLAITDRGPAQIGIVGSRDTIEGGMLVERVVSEGPADMGGVKGLDVVTKVNETKVSNLNDLVDALKAFEPGEKIQVHVKRNSFGEYRPLVLDVTLGGWDP